MPKVIFKIDIERDAKNYYDTANFESRWVNDFTRTIRPEILEKLRGKKWEDVKNSIISMLRRRYSKDREEIKEKLRNFEKAWKKIEAKYFKKLERITQHKIYAEEFICYITTIGRCPYRPKENWFMVNLFSKPEKAVLTCAHELMHLQFHYYFERKLREKISYEKFHDLKEALTILLNLEFSDILKEKDPGLSSSPRIKVFY